MSGDIVTALSRFGETLDDITVDQNSKLKVLRTLSEVKLTLGELSNSGVGRSVRRLKREPGELGRKSRELVIKWKALLDEHIRRENIEIDPIKVPTPRCVPSTGSVKARKVHKRQSEESLPSPMSDKKRKPDGGRPSEPLSSSIDASSGLSFEEAMGTVVPVKKNKKRRSDQLCEKPAPVHSDFTQEILASLAVPIERPDMHCDAPVPLPSAHRSILDDPEEDGNLKFKSKKVMWVPKPRRRIVTDAKGDGVSPANAAQEPPSLIDACLAVLQRNLDLVDHVGKLPYELFSRILENASIDNLRRIERHNAQFRGLTDGLWMKHLHREFPESAGKTPKRNETWATLFERLLGERSQRLDQFINKSASKMRAELESRRTTLTTDAIAPSNIQRRARSQITHSSSVHRHRDAQSKMTFAPRNMSYPSGVPPSSLAGGAGGGGSNGPLSASDQRGGMLDKLRKRFLKGR